MLKHTNKTLGNGTAKVTEAYLVSVNEKQRTEVTNSVRDHYPGARTYDMEAMHPRLESGKKQSHPLHASGLPMYPNGDVHATAIPAGVRPSPPPPPPNGVATIQSVAQVSASHYPLKSTPGRTDMNQNSRPFTHVNGTAENERGRMDRLKSYEEDLKKRKEREEKIAREQEFLRSSLRGSKKLQALEKGFSDGDGYIEGHENVAYEHEHDHRNRSQHSSPIALNEVLLSVTRVADALEQFPEHRRDSQFLKDLFAEREVQNAIDVTLSVQKQWGAKTSGYPTTSEAFLNADGVLRQLGDSISDPAAELQELLERPHLQALLFTHDKIAESIHTDSQPTTSMQSARTSQTVIGTKETVLDGSRNAGKLRIIRMFKADDHYLGATVKNEGERVVIGRIVKGGVVEKSKLLKEGDEVLEVNGVDLRGKTVNDVCDLLRNMTGELTFIVCPAERDETSTDSRTHHADTSMTSNGQLPLVRHMRALFDYDPEDDFYVPCRELAIKFQKGDVLHILSMTDPNWWQAYREGDDPQSHALAGLVPSINFQTQRETYKREVLGDGKSGRVSTDVDPSLLCAKKAKKPKKPGGGGGGKVTHIGAINTTTDQIQTKRTTTNGTAPAEDDADILTYEEVSLYISRTGRKRPVVLVGPPNVGCLELRQMLMEADKDKFAGVVPHTSRPKKSGEQDGVHYGFVNRQKFQEDVNAGKFVEWGEFQKHFYGTSFEAIRKVVDSGKTCILNLKAQSLKALRCSNLMPYVIFISPPSLERLRINKQRHGGTNLKDEDLKGIINEGKTTEEQYGHLFDKVIVNIDLERSFQELRNTIHRLEIEPHWVPSVWLQYDGATNSR